MDAVAVAAGGRRRQLIASLDDDTIRDQPASIGHRVDGEVIETHATARRAGEVERVLATLDPRSLCSGT